MSLDNLTFSRREMLAALGLLTVSCRTAFAADAPACAAKTGPGIALQLYTMREPAKKDLPDTLKQVRAMGWKYVQWSGMPALPAEESRAALDAAGLKAVSAHVGVEGFEKDFDESVRFWKTVGVQALGPGGMMKDCKATLEDWMRGAKRLDELGAKLRAAGIRLSYHNHSWEFEKFPEDPRCKLDILMEATGAENIFAELDLGWLLNGGADPATYIRKYKGRCPMVHAKDLIPGKDGAKAKLVPLGQGALNWPEIFAAGQEAGIEWYIYEQDNGEGSPFDYARASYEFLAKHFPQSP